MKDFIEVTRLYFCYDINNAYAEPKLAEEPIIIAISEITMISGRNIYLKSLDQHIEVKESYEEIKSKIITAQNNN